MRAKAQLVSVMIVLTAAGWLGSGLPLPAQDNGSLLDRFHSEAPEAWTKYRSRSKRLQGSVSHIDFGSTPAKNDTTKTVNTEWRVEFKQREGCALWVTQNSISAGRPSQAGSMEVVNPRYGFQLRRRTLDGSWTVSEVSVNPTKNGLSFDDPRPVVEGWCNYPLTPLSLKEDLATMVKYPKFQIKRVLPISRGTGRSPRSNLRIGLQN